MTFEPQAGFSVALYQPDIAGNTGTILRTAVCLGFTVEIIEPAGFDLSDRALRRAGLDYAERAVPTRHLDFGAFENARKAAGARIVLFTTKAALSLEDLCFRRGDILLFGRESSGVPDLVHDAADERVRIPILESARSLNLAVSVGIAAFEARRQFGAGRTI